MRHPLRSPSRRCAGALAGGLLLTVLLAGCGGAPSGTTDDATDDVTAASDAGGAFPVTLQHAFGETVVDELPESIVVVGFKEQDYYLALGEVPVAIRDWYGEMPSATWPWAQDLLGDEEPVVLERAELDYEQIAALQPDVIVGMSAGLTEEEYDLLAQIAPTVAQPSAEDPYAVTWQEMTRAAGSLLGRSDDAETMVADLEADIAAVAIDHPELTGTDVVFASGWDGDYYVFSPETTASTLLLDFGLTMTDEITGLTANDNQYAQVSREQLNLLDSGVTVFSEGLDDEMIQALLTDPLYTGLAVHQEGRDVFLGTEANGAFVFSSVLSLPYVLDTVVPAVVAAADGDPATRSAFSPDPE